MNIPSVFPRWVAVIAYLVDDVVMAVRKVRMWSEIMNTSKVTIVQTDLERAEAAEAMVVRLIRKLNEICGDGWRAADGSEEWIAEENYRDYKSEVDSLKVMFDELQDRYDKLMDRYDSVKKWVDPGGDS